ncbi:hypothetical protein MXAN_3994 [Myxococcus xanthus DK 1622]|uniref:LysM domain-containing protein n=1 Tax=Myxococcus xanthus (strain DK1622) TaxID=246197 RepID=Q1D599_MYXXD|nr:MULTISPECIES: LysM domain-containing protein [Myxococcus]ABF85919.1 hypothetical protein MXAN_3994 [Myxococcus xanthus DK 1622]NOJ51581.1 LysM peptidoglycan-binding domain-containing protein [Myxococcus xanthus]QPM76616.1 LysM peptidoglycan-binding domain-containing protein [Myxococcus xanthus]QVW65680.1 LysM peptidoglycan-binding domain-containing protein [Myxococcus xanthus DZ2]QZZ51684.1 hypothetical protein MyxoNM_20995 [Myxococcus xanthus]
MFLHPCLKDGLREYIVLALHEGLPNGYTLVTPARGWALERRLRQFAQDSSNQRTLQSLVYIHGHRSGMRAPLPVDEVVRQAALLLDSGVLRLAQAPPREAAVSPSFSVPQPGGVPVPVEEPVWLRLQVVDDTTDVPIAGIQLRIQLDDRSEHQARTDSEGRIDLKGVPKGGAHVLSDLEGATLDNTLALVRTGGPWSQQKPAKRGQRARGASGPRFLARVTQHRVIDGETLESVAEMYGLTVEELTRFNWNTTDAADIERHLILDVGCTRKGSRGQYVFTREDDPGILYVPRPEAIPRLPVEHSHILRVKRVPEPRHFLFSL